MKLSNYDHGLQELHLEPMEAFLFHNGELAVVSINGGRLFGVNKNLVDNGRIQYDIQEWIDEERAVNTHVTIKDISFIAHKPYKHIVNYLRGNYVSKGY